MELSSVLEDSLQYCSSFNKICLAVLRNAIIISLEQLLYSAKHGQNYKELKCMKKFKYGTRTSWIREEQRGKASFPHIGKILERFSRRDDSQALWNPGRIPTGEAITCHPATGEPAGIIWKPCTGCHDYASQLHDPWSHPRCKPYHGIFLTAGLPLLWTSRNKHLPFHGAF